MDRSDITALFGSPRRLLSSLLPVLKLRGVALLFHDLILFLRESHVQFSQGTSRSKGEGGRKVVVFEKLFVERIYKSHIAFN